MANTFFAYNEAGKYFSVEEVKRLRPGSRLWKLWLPVSCCFILFGRQNDGSVLVNALELYGVNPLEKQSRVTARLLAVRELPRIIAYMRKKIPGLGHARLAGVAPKLYTRESRHMEGLYRLNINDVLDNRDFPDRIACGSYPVDIQPAGPDDTGNIIGRPEQYAIPFRCLVPRGVDNLLVTGRSASFDSLAAGSARVIPVGMADGQAAGAATALSIEKGLGFPALSKSPLLIRELQNRLNKQGMYIHPFHIASSRDRYAAGLCFMRRWGLAAGGYDNNYRLNETMTTGQFVSDLKEVTEAMALKMPLPAAMARLPEKPGNQLSMPLAAALCCAFWDYKLPPETAFQYLSRRGFWVSGQRQPENLSSPLTRGEAYVLIERFAAFHLQPEPLPPACLNRKKVLPAKEPRVDLARIKHSAGFHQARVSPVRPPVAPANRGRSRQT